ncbi:hypothetical protein [Photobacterium damselae]|uniref:hypothetical protein n=1 Tax=Photobacterium damselae TaxID=38293 RepID=UPI004067E574
MKNQFILSLFVCSLFVTHLSIAGTDADEVDISTLSASQADMIQAELNIFSQIAIKQVSSRDELKIKNELREVIYCGYDAFANQQDKFLQLTKSNESMIFNTAELRAKYQKLATLEKLLPNDLSVCSKFHVSA